MSFAQLRQWYIFKYNANRNAEYESFKMESMENFKI